MKILKGSSFLQFIVALIALREIITAGNELKLHYFFPLLMLLRHLKIKCNSLICHPLLFKLSLNSAKLKELSQFLIFFRLI